MPKRQSERSLEAALTGLMQTYGAETVLNAAHVLAARQVENETLPKALRREKKKQDIGQRWAHRWPNQSSVRCRLSTPLT